MQHRRACPDRALPLRVWSLSRAVLSMIVSSSCWPSARWSPCFADGIAPPAALVWPLALAVLAGAGIVSTEASLGRRADAAPVRRDARTST